jgi:hypothetical protein
MKVRTAGLAVVPLAALGASGNAADVWLELVGVVSNMPAGVTPAISTQFGYLSYVLGLPVFRSKPDNETTALYAFNAQATTIRVLRNGPLRTITRVGTFTVYRHADVGSTFGASRPPTRPRR